MSVNFGNNTTNGGIKNTYFEGNRFPWLPSVFVAVSLLVFLGLSFAKYHRKVSKKRQATLDYMLVHSRMLRRRTLAPLCNTYSISIKDLASSVRIRVPNASVCLKSVDSFNYNMTSMDSNDYVNKEDNEPFTPYFGATLNDSTSSKFLDSALSFSGSEWDYSQSKSPRPPRFNLSGIHSDESYDKNRIKRKRWRRSFSLDDYWLGNKKRYHALNLMDDSFDTGMNTSDDLYQCSNETGSQHENTYLTNAKKIPEDSVLLNDNQTSERDSFINIKTQRLYQKPCRPNRQQKLVDKRKRLTKIRHCGNACQNCSAPIRQDANEDNELNMETTLARRMEKLNPVSYKSKSVSFETRTFDKGANVRKRICDIRSDSAPSTSVSHTLILFSHQHKNETGLASDFLPFEENSKLTASNTPISTRSKRKKIFAHQKNVDLNSLELRVVNDMNFENAEGSKASKAIFNQNGLSNEIIGDKKITLDISNQCPILFMLHQNLRDASRRALMSPRSLQCNSSVECASSVTMSQGDNSAITINNNELKDCYTDKILMDSAAVKNTPECSDNLQNSSSNRNFTNGLINDAYLWSRKSWKMYADRKKQEQKRSSERTNPDVKGEKKGETAKVEKSGNTDNDIFWLDVHDGDDTMV
ncbi:uncharacterized protein LOC126807787 isoform X1 [Patella vulgata]|uniref:uncharacterized protein LOC126807787 isoform X1 n=1 Tax=Patella vulgata TaxID=6465 RepID=UPI00217FA142|nr:uncharacterized protein LOC126807787 isoform X1 [Patella vulgata]